MRPAPDVVLPNAMRPARMFRRDEAPVAAGVSEIRSAQLLDSVVDITSETDREHFRSSLANTVRELLQIEDVGFLRPLSNAAGELVFQEMHCTLSSAPAMGGRPDVRAEQVVQMLRGGYCLDRGDDHTSLLLPVLVREALAEVVVLRAPSIPPEAVSLLRGFTRLYRNFVALISEGERDPLTGLLNRRVLETRLTSVAREHERRGSVTPLRAGQDRRTDACPGPNFIAILDIDHFKRVNDTFGHLFGDEVILLVSQLMREVFRDDDMLFRYGGEEFVAILTTPCREGARSALERFRERVAARRFPQLEQVTVSVGFAEMHGRELPAAVIARADRALYCAKDDGRNRVYDYDALAAQGRFAEGKVGNEVELF